VVNSLPDNIFLEIFAFCLSNVSEGYWYPSSHAREWQRLVQVCQRWQQIIYGSPHYLDLHLHCSYETPFDENLSRWPEFPLTILYSIHWDGDDKYYDLIDALEQPDRVHRVNLSLASSVWSSDSKVDEVFEVMSVPFPALTHLDLKGPDPGDDDKELGIILPDDFLGESAPCLQHLFFHEITCHELPQLLLSARGLVSLQLEDIPPNAGYGYNSPEAMVGGLAGLTRLRTLSMKFRYPQDPPYSSEGLEKGRRPDPPMRAALPALTRFVFSGESKYLEELMARIDVPSVEDIEILYFPTVFEVHELSQFIDRTEKLELAQFRRAQVTFDGLDSQIKLDRPQGERHQVRFSLAVQIEDSGDSDLEDPDSDDPDSDLLVPCMARVLGRLAVLLSNVGHLSFDSPQDWFEPLDNSILLQLLHLFPAVEELHVSRLLAGHIATVLENIAEERVTEVMPALHSLRLGNVTGNEPVGSIERFLSLRQLSGRPVTVGSTQDEFVG
jgi:hypothetical protein